MVFVLCSQHNSVLTGRISSAPWSHVSRGCYIEKHNTRKWMCPSDVENKPMDTKGAMGDGGMNWETVIDIYTLWILCTKWITNENLL